jgi:RNA polymerase sigma-70 factor (ECF subfamily)
VNADDLNSRLSRISTIWTLLSDAQKSLRTRADDARLALIQRYQGAAYRYLLGALRNPDAADELFQEFALRVMQGAFAHADPERGRFRSYLKTMLYHLIVDYQRRQQRLPRSLQSTVADPAGPGPETPESDRQFLASWRDEILARAWASLAEAERNGGQPFHSVLKFRAEHPDASSADMAERLTGQLPAHPFTEAGVRKALQRARAQFADLLLDDVAHSLGEHSPDQLEEELIALDLLPYCRSALKRRRGQGAP